MKTKKQLLEEIKELEQNIEDGKMFAALGYNNDMILQMSESLLEQAREELRNLETKEV